MSEPLDVTAIAAEPASTSGDQGSATNRPIPEVIAADQYAAAKAAVSGRNSKGGPKSGWKALRAARFVPDGGRS